MPEPGRVLSRQEIATWIADARWFEEREGEAYITSAESAFARQTLALARSHEQLREALEEVHEFQCGCDRPGSAAKCVAKPEGTFAALSAGEEQQT